MTLGIFVETILLRINGGVLPVDSAVQRVDIQAYVPAAVNYAREKSYNINLQLEGNRDIPSTFYGQFDDLPILRDKKQPYIAYPKGTVSMRGNQGIRFITDNCCGSYSPLSDNDMSLICYYGDKMIDMKFYRPKQANIELFGASPLAETINMEMIVRVEDLDDDDELPIDAGFEADALNICWELISGQREIPADKRSDNSDINTVR